MHASHARAQHGALTNALALAAMFNRPLGSALYQPSKPVVQLVAADVDQDGDEDKTAIRLVPLTGDAGKAIAAGATEDIVLEPVRWSQVLNFVFVPEDTEGLIVTAFTVGQDPQFPTNGKAGIPLAIFAADSTNALIDVPYCGPNVPLTLSVKNTTAGSKTLYGAARANVIIG